MNAQSYIGSGACRLRASPGTMWRRTSDDRPRAPLCHLFCPWSAMCRASPAHPKYARLLHTVVSSVSGLDPGCQLERCPHSRGHPVPAESDARSPTQSGKWSENSNFFPTLDELSGGLELTATHRAPVGLIVERATLDISNKCSIHGPLPRSFIRALWVPPWIYPTSTPSMGSRT